MCGPGLVEHERHGMFRSRSTAAGASSAAVEPTAIVSATSQTRCRGALPSGTTRTPTVKLRRLVWRTLMNGPSPPWMRIPATRQHGSLRRVLQATAFGRRVAGTSNGAYSHSHSFKFAARRVTYVVHSSDSAQVPPASADVLVLSKG
jgi:hypothetical protein